MFFIKELYFNEQIHMQFFENIVFFLLSVEYMKERKKIFYRFKRISAVSIMCETCTVVT